MTYHTELPWVAYDDGKTAPRGSAEVATIASVGCWIVGVATPGFPGGNYRDIDAGTEEGDAKFIAKACNQHDELEAMCDDFAATIESMRDENRDYMRLNHLGDPTQQHNDKRATAALARYQTMKDAAK